MSTSDLHKLWVIESLGDQDIKTGRRLRDGELTTAQHRHPHLEISYETPRDKKTILNLLTLVRDEARNQGVYPMLHFECHGNESGLGTASGELVAWDDLRLLCIQINHACRLNLVVVLAACNGLHFINTARKLDYAPYWAAIGPEEKVYEGDLATDFGAFYAEFFASLNGDAAMNALNPGRTRDERVYHFSGIERIFLGAYAAYYKKNCTGGGRNERAQRLIEKIMRDPKVRARGETWAHEQVDAQLSGETEESSFESKRRQYFFLDQFPEIEDRLALTYAMVLERAANLP